MHSIVELEIADVEFSLAYVVMQGIESRLIDGIVLSQFGVQPRYGVEVPTLVRVIESLAEIWIPQGIARLSAGSEGRAEDEQPCQAQEKTKHELPAFERYRLAAGTRSRYGDPDKLRTNILIDFEGLSVAIFGPTL